MHFVPHSHLDAGWLQTYDAYYSYPVKGIFDSVLSVLETDAEARYTVGDLAFFRRYFVYEIDEERREVIRALVRSGQLDLVHGGMVSNDEACANYTDIVRNYEMGHDFLMSEFGIKPKIAWQLDPFGHSAANAALLAEMGLETVVFARMNEDEGKHRKLEQDMQFFWQPRFKTFETSPAAAGVAKTEEIV